MEGTPRNCCRCVTPCSSKVFREIQHCLKPGRRALGLFPSHDVTLGRAPSLPSPQFPHPPFLSSPSRRGAVHPYTKTSPKFPETCVQSKSQTTRHRKPSSHLQSETQVRGKQTQSGSGCPWAKTAGLTPRSYRKH